MARATRKVLDLALVSLEKIQPAVAKVWDKTKTFITDSPAKPLVQNRAVDKIETSLGSLTKKLSSKLEAVRDRQLPAEAKYLEKELDEVKKRLSESKSKDCAAKNITSFGATSWKYLKVEAVPPLTTSFFNGPAGRKLESVVGKLADGFVGAIQGRIKEIDDEEARAKREKIAAEKAREEKIKAEAKKKEEEKMKAAAAKAAEAVKQAAAIAAKKKAEEEAAKAKAKPKDEKLVKKKTKGKKRKAPKGKAAASKGDAPKRKAAPKGKSAQKGGAESKDKGKPTGKTPPK